MIMGFGWPRQELHSGLGLHRARGAIQKVWVSDFMIAARLLDKSDLLKSLEQVP